MTVLYPTHTCFDDAMEILEQLVKTIPKPALVRDARLVHAVCWIAGLGDFSHAWVELGDVCFFAGILDSKKEYFTQRKEGFYEKLQVKDVTRYTLFEVWEQNQKHKTYGPWEERYIKLCTNKRNQN